MIYERERSPLKEQPSVEEVVRVFGRLKLKETIYYYLFRTVVQGCLCGS